MKVNPITKNAEIMRGVYALSDGKFTHGNPYGYITNLKDAEIQAEYENFKELLKEKILSDEDRFFFDALMIERFRPELKELVCEFKEREGTVLQKLVAKSIAGDWTVELLFDEGMSKKWMVRTPEESISEENGLVAINIYTEKSSRPLQKRIGNYYERQGLSRYTGE